jgi:hypothetical protein
MSTLFEFPELIDSVNAALDALSSKKGSAENCSTQEECELYDGTGPITLEELPTKVLEIIRRLIDSRNSDLIPHYQRFQKLWAGNWQDLYPSQSEADAAFCGLLAREGLDSLEIDMAVRASGLYREKWERPDYRGRTMNGVMANTKASNASESNQDESSKMEWVSEMNERYALVRIGTDIQVMDFQTPNQGSRKFSAKPMKITTFKSLLAGQFVEVSKEKSLPKTTAWLNHPSRRQFEGVSYSPGEKTASNVLNLWNGFAVEPKVGDISPWKKLHSSLIPNPELAEWVVKWLAWRLQNLDKIPGTVLIFRGKKGTGKNSLFEPVITFFGEHSMVVDDPELIIGRFNWHLMAQSFVVLDEAVFAGDLRQGDKLKSRITATQMTFEAKGMTPISGANRCAYVMLTNHEHVWQATLDERRVVVIDVGDELRGDTEFWRRYFSWLQSDGASYLLHYLQGLDVAHFDPRRIPAGTALEDQIALTALRDPAVAWWHQCLTEGCIRWSDGFSVAIVELESNKPTAVERSALRLSYEQSAGVRGRYSLAWDVVAKRIRHWCQPHEITESRRTSLNRKRIREDILPSLGDMQSSFSEQTGLKF